MSKTVADIEKLTQQLNAKVDAAMAEINNVEKALAALGVEASYQIDKDHTIQCGRLGEKWRISLTYGETCKPVSDWPREKKLLVQLHLHALLNAAYEKAERLLNGQVVHKRRKGHPDSWTE
jgi:hypothetical protein